MPGMVIKRFQNAVEKAVGKRNSNTSDVEDLPVDGDSPEANAVRGVKDFCESPADEASGDEVLHLPVIVEAAESSPQAASAAARQIRKFLSKENYSRPQVQYNAVMLIRILVDNPGATFTKSLDTKFTQTVKELLRNSRDQSVQQITRETLGALYQEKAYDTNLATLFAMWTKEQPNQPRPQQLPRMMNAPQYDPNMPPQPQGFGGGPSADHFSRGRHGHGGNTRQGLPPPRELAARVEEAKTSAKLLQQLVQSTPPQELQNNDLIKEFGQRVAAAQRSVQGYICCDAPPPDEDTLQTLVETSEQLSLAASRHQRALLQARRLVGAAHPPVAPSGGDVPITLPPALPSRPGGLTEVPHEGSGQPAQQATYLPPSGPPPPPKTNQAAYSPDSEDEDELYDAPTHPPPSLPPNIDRRCTPPRQAQSGEDPFADEHAPPPNPSTDGVAPRAGAGEDEHDGGGGAQSYHPGYQSSPSYLQRQQSSADKLTMRGADGGGAGESEGEEERAKGA